MRKIFEVSDADCIFPTARNIPPKEEIPKEFWHGDTVWNQCFNDWFFCGIEGSQLTPKPGVDRNKAIRAIKSIIGSWEPKHEHKEAAVAYLLSEWFERYDRDQAAIDEKLNEKLKR